MSFRVLIALVAVGFVLAAGLATRASIHSECAYAGVGNLPRDGAIRLML